MSTSHLCGVVSTDKVSIANLAVHIADHIYLVQFFFSADCVKFYSFLVGETIRFLALTSHLLKDY